MDYKFENLTRYEITFLHFTNVTSSDNGIGNYLKPMKVRVVGIYVGETEDYIKFTMGIAENNNDYNRIAIPKSNIIEKPLKLLYARESIAS